MDGAVRSCLPWCWRQRAWKGGGEGQERAEGQREGGAAAAAAGWGRARSIPPPPSPIHDLAPILACQSTHPSPLLPLSLSLLPSALCIRIHAHAARLEVLKLEKAYDKSEDDLKALQSIGQIIGEVLKQLDNDKCTCSRGAAVGGGLGCVVRDSPLHDPSLA